MTRVLLTGLLAIFVAAALPACTKSEESKGGAPAAAPAEKTQTAPAETPPGAAAAKPTAPGTAPSAAVPAPDAQGSPQQPPPAPDKVQT